MFSLEYPVFNFSIYICCIFKSVYIPKEDKAWIIITIINANTMEHYERWKIERTFDNKLWKWSQVDAQCIK